MMGMTFIKTRNENLVEHTGSYLFSKKNSLNMGNFVFLLNKVSFAHFPIL